MSAILRKELHLDHREYLPHCVLVKLQYLQSLPLYCFIGSEGVMGAGMEGDFWLHNPDVYHFIN